MSDPVNHPAHYRTGRIEVIEFIRDQDLPYLAGNVVKYVSRYRHKGKPLEDLKKARWYLQRLIDELEKEAGVMDEAQEKAVQQVAKDLAAVPPKVYDLGRVLPQDSKVRLERGAGACSSVDLRHSWVTQTGIVYDGRPVARCASCDGLCFVGIAGDL